MDKLTWTDHIKRAAKNVCGESKGKHMIEVYIHGGEMKVCKT